MVRASNQAMRLSASTVWSFQIAAVYNTAWLEILEFYSNQALSERRAQSVVDYLISKGIPADKISARGMGESNPVTGNTCDNVKQRAALIDCLAPDRRVEIEVKGIKDVVTQPQA